MNEARDDAARDDAARDDAARAGDAAGNPAAAMKLVLISGLSGSGKSIALNVLEDSGYICIDNLPVKLLSETVQVLRESGATQVALAIDARSGTTLAPLPGYVRSLRDQGIDLKLIFLDARNDVLIRRFSETRRRHPLAHGDRTLAESLSLERELLAPVAEIGHRIDTTRLLPGTLRDWIKELLGIGAGSVTILFESFGYKAGIPLDADLIFDARCLPNPYYVPRLRPLTGHDPEVAEFLQRDPRVRSLLADITRFLDAWLPSYVQDDRSYVTVGIGCTGGQHRSVYLVEQLAAHFRTRFPSLVRHREIASS